jgi:hypothetical protein
MEKKTIITKLIGDVLDIQSQKEYITVAELKTIEKNGFKETIDVNTAIIPNTLIGKIKPSHVNPFVERSGVNYDKDYEYKPSFWLYLSKASGLKKAEPLVVSWCSGNHTTFNIDQGFLSTFHLSPRLLSDEILWDDLKKPIYAVVKNKSLSEYKFPIHSEAYVKIRKSYLENYLYLRKKVAVQVFSIKKNISIGKEISFLLKNKDYFMEEYDQFEVRIRKYDHNEKEAVLEINGFKILLQEDKDNTEESEASVGHYWKGIEGLVKRWRALHEMPFEYIYVSDKVLAEFEVDDDYDVYPLSGSVSYRNQWSVDHCKRVGRNAIKIEIKKLYEGNRYDVIDYWNKFSIHPSEIIEGQNIALKAEQLVKRFFCFGRLLATIFNQVFGVHYSATDIISLDESHIEYTGWSDFLEYKAIAHHIDLKFFSKEQFLSRCKKLYILLGENLKESTLRKVVVVHIQFPEIDTKKIRSLKLLEIISKYLYIAQSSGLNPSTNNLEIVERVKKLKEFHLLSKLFALNDIRQLDAHKGSNSKSKLYDALTELGIEPNSITNNYADSCFNVFDELATTFEHLNNFLGSFIYE